MSLESKLLNNEKESVSLIVKINPNFKTHFADGIFDSSSRQQYKVKETTSIERANICSRNTMMNLTM